MASIKGGCMCGAVRYECGGDPLYMFNCHCRDCQRYSGSAYFAVLGVPRSTLKVTGQVKFHEAKRRQRKHPGAWFLPELRLLGVRTQLGGVRHDGAPRRKSGRPKYLQAGDGHLRFQRPALGSYEPGAAQVSRDAAEGINGRAAPAVRSAPGGPARHLPHYPYSPLNPHGGHSVEHPGGPRASGVWASPSMRAARG